MLRLLNSRVIACAMMPAVAFAPPGRAQPQTAAAPAAQTRPALDLAALAPPETLMYFEAARLDQQLDAIEHLLQRAGIAEPFQWFARMAGVVAPATQPGLAGAAMLLTPEMIREYRKIDGVCLAILDLPARGTENAPFLVGLHFGESNALRAAVKLMLANLAPEAESKPGWTLHRFAGGLEIGLLDRTAIMGWPQGQVAAAVARAAAGKPGLLSTPGVRERIEQARRQGGVLALVAWPRLAAAIRAGSGEHARMLARAERTFAFEDLTALWAHATFGPDTLSARVRADWATGNAPAYRLLRSRPLDRTILEYVPADSLACIALSMDQAADRHKALIETIAVAQGRGGNLQAVREELEKAESSLGIRFREAFETIESLAVAVLPPDIATIARREAPATPATRPSVPTRAQIVRSSAFAVVQVRDAARFDRMLERVAGLMPLKAEPQTRPAVEVDRRTGPGAERRTYRAGDEICFHAIQQGSHFIIAGRPELAEAALAARQGQVRHLLVEGTTTRAALSQLPPDTSKVLVLRLDLAINMMTALRTLEWGVAPGRVLYLPVPSMRPAVAYTLESPQRLEIAATASDLPILIRHLLQIVPRPPRITPRPATATQPR